MLACLPVGNGAPSIFNTDFLKNIFEMKFNRVQTHIEDDGNFPIRLASGDPPENFLFPFA